MSEKLTDAGTIADPSSFHQEQHGGKWWPPPNEKLTRKSRSINQRDKSFLIRNSTKCPLLEHFVILFWLLDSKHFSQAIDIPFSNFRSCQQEANYMLALENCKEADSVIPMQLLVQVELLELVELGLELVQSVTPIQFLVCLPLPPWAEANFVGGGIGWRRVINSAKCIQCSETIKPHAIEQSVKYTSCSDAMMSRPYVPSGGGEWDMWSSNLVRQCRRDRFSRDDQGCRRRCNVSRGVRIGDILTGSNKQTHG